MKSTEDDPEFDTYFRSFIESMRWAESYRAKHGEPTEEQIAQARQRAYDRIKSGLQ